MTSFITLIIVIVGMSLICEGAPTSREEGITTQEEGLVNPEVTIAPSTTPSSTLSLPEVHLTLDISVIIIAILLYCFFRFCALNSCYGCFNSSLSHEQEHVPLLKRHEQQRLRSKLFLFEEDKEQPVVLSVY